MPEQTSTFVLEGTGGNFRGLVVENSRKGPVVVDFWSPRVGPSLRQRDVLSRLAREYGGRFLLVTVNTDRERSIADEFGVRSLPSCKLFRRGKVVEHLHGLQTEVDYRAAIDRHLATAADHVQRAALRAWREGDRDGAVRVLAEGAVAEPGRVDLPVLLVKLLIRLDRHEDALAVLRALPEPLSGEAEVERLDAHLDLILTARSAPSPAELAGKLAAEPQDLDARFQLAAVSLLADDYDAAATQLLAIQRQNPRFRGGAAGRGLRALFDLLGPDDERVRRYRRELMGLAP